MGPSRREDKGNAGGGRSQVNAAAREGQGLGKCPWASSSLSTTYPRIRERGLGTCSRSVAIALREISEADVAEVEMELTGFTPVYYRLSFSERGVVDELKENDVFFAILDTASCFSRISIAESVSRQPHSLPRIWKIRVLKRPFELVNGPVACWWRAS